MMEGHSFDNYLGTSGRGAGFTMNAAGIPVDVNLLPNGQRVSAHHLASTVQISGVPTDTRNASNIQYDNGTCGGFATSVLTTVPGGRPDVPMGYWTQADLPFYHSLAQVFPVADHWFASFLGPAHPNRRFLVAGTAHGLVDDRPLNIVDSPAAGTIFDLLNKHGISWVNYQGSARALAAIGPVLLGGGALTIGRRVLRALSVINPFRFAYDRYGFRVPAVLVSPYAKPDYVSSTLYDHTSVLALIEHKWNLPPLTKRDASAADPLDMLDLTSPPAFLTPPELAPPRRRFNPGRLPVVNAATAFSIESTRDFPTRIIQVIAAWAVGFLAFSYSLPWLQTLVLAVLTLLTVNGVSHSGFWRIWAFWRPQRHSRRVAVYNAVFAFITLSAFSALLSSELYLYGPFRIADHRPGGNILWMYTGTYFWNLVDAVPGLEIPSTLHWASPLEVSGLWGEFYLILFRLLVLTPVLSLIVESVQADRKDKDR
jgi:phospholipase C